MAEVGVEVTVLVGVLVGVSLGLNGRPDQPANTAPVPTDHILSESNNNTSMGTM